MTKAKNRKQSAIKLADHLLKIDQSEIENSHLRELLSVLIWKYTQSEGKYTLRFRSEQAIQETNPKNLVHEHVVERKKLVDLLMARRTSAQEIFKSAVACVVTKDEHAKLNSLPIEIDGWDRYIAANIKVIDTKKEKDG